MTDWCSLNGKHVGAVERCFLSIRASPYHRVFEGSNLMQPVLLCLHHQSTKSRVSLSSWISFSCLGLGCSHVANAFFGNMRRKESYFHFKMFCQAKLDGKSCI